MKHEIKKIMKIADEVMTFCMYNYEAEHADFSVRKRGENYEMSFLFHDVAISVDELEAMKKKLKVKRNPELENYYWQLTGEIENSSELALVAMMSDRVTVDYRDNALSILIIRKSKHQ